MTDPLVRKASPEDVPEMVDVLRAAYPQWPPVRTDAAAADYLLWKMSPRGEFAPDTHTLVEVDGRIAALQLRWLGSATIRLPDRIAEYPTDVGADLAVHPDFRGRGLARVIAEHERERLHTAGHLAFDTISHSEQVRHMSRPGQAIRMVGIWTRPLSRRHALVAAVRRLGRRSTPDTQGAEATTRVEALNRFDDRVDRLWERIHDRYDLIRRRDAAYLNWRYAPPAGPARAFAVSEDDRILALAVARLGNPAGLIAELLVDPDAPDTVVPQLLEVATRFLREHGAPTATCWLPVGHHLEPALEAAGFHQESTQAVRSDTVRLVSIPEVIPVFQDPHARFHITIGDFDFV